MIPLPAAVHWVTDLGWALILSFFASAALAAVYAVNLVNHLQMAVVLATETGDGIDKIWAQDGWQDALDIDLAQDQVVTKDPNDLIF